MKLLLLSLIFVGFQTSANLPEGFDHQRTKLEISETQYFLQFYVSEVNDAEDQRKVQNFLAAKQEVYMARMDRTTRICFIILQPGTDLSKEILDKELKELGHQMSCFRKATYGVDQPYSKENFQCN